MKVCRPIIVKGLMEDINYPSAHYLFEPITFILTIDFSPPIWTLDLHQYGVSQ